MSFEKRPSAVITTTKGQQVLIKKHKIVAGAVASLHTCRNRQQYKNVWKRSDIVICVCTLLCLYCDSVRYYVNILSLTNIQRL